MQFDRALALLAVEMRQQLAGLSAEGSDARDYLKTWRMILPEEFDRMALAVLADVKGLPRSKLGYRAG